jgi:Ca2+-binding RTX toxin-like protein
MRRATSTGSPTTAADDTIRLDDLGVHGADDGETRQRRLLHRLGAHDIDDRIIYDSASGALYYDSNGSAADGSVKFAQLSAGLALTNADFYVT